MTIPKQASLSRNFSEEHPEFPPDPPFWSRTSFVQIMYSVWVNLTMVAIGLAFGWTAVSLPQLMAAESPIILTLSEQAWIASCLTLSSPLGCLFSGYIIDSYGRRAALIMCEMPMCLGWLMMATADTASFIIIGRLVSGFGIGLAMAAPRTYTTEITLPKMRGLVGAFPCFAVSLGITIQSILGSYLQWNTICFMSAMYCGLLSITFTLLPESPYFVLINKAIHEVEPSLKKFRSKTFDLKPELDALQDYKETNDIHKLTFRKKLGGIATRAACKPFAISITYIFIMQLSGVNVITVWAIEMFQMAKTTVDANLANVLLGITRTGFSVITSVLLYRIQRRTLALSSSIGVAVAALAFSAFLESHKNPSIYPLVFLEAYMAFATLGYYILPLLMMFEILPLQVRGILGSFGVSFLNIMIFALNKAYPYARNTFGLAKTIGCFGIASTIGSIILFMIIPETKDLTLQEIEEFFNSTRPTLVSQRSVLSTQMSRVHTSANLVDEQNKHHKLSKRSLKEMEESRLEFVKKAKNARRKKEGKENRNEKERAKQNDKNVTENAKNATENAKNATDNAKNDTKNDTENEKNATENAKNATDNAKNDTKNTKNDTENAKNATENAKNATDSAKNDTKNTKNDTENAKNDTKNTKNDTTNTKNDTENKKNDKKDTKNGKDNTDK